MVDAGRAVVSVGGHRLPGRAELSLVLLHVRAAGLAQPIAAPTFLGVGLDQPLVLELLEGRVDRARARLPHPAAALGDLLDDLVAVARLLRKQDQDGSPNVTLADTWAAAERPPVERPAAPAARTAEPERVAAKWIAAERVAAKRVPAVAPPEWPPAGRWRRRLAGAKVARIAARIVAVLPAGVAPAERRLPGVAVVLPEPRNASHQ